MVKERLKPPNELFRGTAAKLVLGGDFPHVR
jgi:hypothetical protein